MPVDATSGGTEPQEGSGPPQPQAGADSTPQAGAAQTGQAPSAGSSSGTEDVAALRSEIADLRRENAASRTKLRGYEEAQRTAQEAGLSDLQKAQARVAELEPLPGTVRELRLQVAVLEAASELGFSVKPGLLHRLLDPGKVEWSDEGPSGRPKNVPALLRELAASEPSLTKKVLPDLGGGPRGGPTPPAEPSMNDLLRAAATGGQ